MAKAKKEDSGDSSSEEKEKTSFWLLKSTQRSLRYIAFMSELNQTQVINQALTDLIERWEKKNGPIPKR